MEQLQPKDDYITSHARRFAAEHFDCNIDDLHIQSVSGGYSRNRRNLVGHDDQWIFVKEVDTTILPDDGERELGWLRKDFEIGQHLMQGGFSLAPEWSKLSDDGKVLLLPSYRAEDGWIWQFPEDEGLRSEYIQAVVNTTKQLEGADFSSDEVVRLQLQPFFRDEIGHDEGFDLLMHDEEMHQRVVSKIESMLPTSTEYMRPKMIALHSILDNVDAIRALHEDAKTLLDQPNDCFGHCDVRSDNIAYNPATKAIKFVDWNWAAYTPAGFGATEFLVDAARHGVDVSPWHENINPQLLVATIGYYAQRCINEPHYSGSTLREMQVESAAIALDIYTKMKEGEQ